MSDSNNHTDDFTDNDDPLQLKDLAVDFDYLMFKIKDHISGLAELTHKSVTTKKHLIEEDYFKQQLQLDSQLDDADSMLKECSELEMLFMKLGQLQTFVEDFKTRLSKLETHFVPGN
ncbi:hypothetical protein JCM33374_g3782 [Metschnikowia sp. JCM 33374]|nr:hypothetical protein JCM33374_g3782 [Metschnikowia sp. JCM 33374]